MKFENSEFPKNEPENRVQFAAEDVFDEEPDIPKKQLARKATGIPHIQGNLLK